MSRVLSAEDLEFRRLVEETGGDQKKLAAHYGVTPSAISHRLWSQKHSQWWVFFKEGRRSTRRTDNPDLAGVIRKRLRTPEGFSLPEMEKTALEEASRLFRNLRKAAGRLGLDERTLRSKLHEHNIVFHENDPEQLLSTTDVARELRVSNSSIRRLIHEGRLPASQVSSRWLVKRKDLDDLRTSSTDYSEEDS